MAIYGLYEAINGTIIWKWAQRWVNCLNKTQRSYYPCHNAITDQQTKSLLS